MAEKYMKKYSITSLQGNARQRHKKHHLFPVGIMMIIIKEKKSPENNKAWQGCRNGRNSWFYLSRPKGKLMGGNVNSQSV